MDNHTSAGMQPPELKVEATSDAEATNGEKLDPDAVKRALADAVAAAKAKAAAAAATSDQYIVTGVPSVVKDEPSAAEASSNGTESRGRPKKKRFGPPANALAPAPKPRKRRSRWETDDSKDVKTLTIASAPMWPTDVTLPGGIKVILPPHLTGKQMSSDPAIQGKYEELWKVEGFIRDEKYEIPPEHERSPSPPPIYDRFGIRLNTREVRMKEKLQDKRCDLIEELIRIDPHYAAPHDYRPRKKSRKIFIPLKEYPGYNFIGVPI